MSKLTEILTVENAPHVPNRLLLEQYDGTGEAAQQSDFLPPVRLSD